MNTPVRISLAAAVVLGTAGLAVLMAMYLWVALSVVGLALLVFGYVVYDFLSLHAKD